MKMFISLALVAFAACSVAQDKKDPDGSSHKKEEAPVTQSTQKTAATNQGKEEPRNVELKFRFIKGEKYKHTFAIKSKKEGDGPNIGLDTKIEVISAIDDVEKDGSALTTNKISYCKLTAEGLGNIELEFKNGKWVTEIFELKVKYPVTIEEIKQAVEKSRRSRLTTSGNIEPLDEEEDSFNIFGEDDGSFFALPAKQLKKGDKWENDSRVGKIDYSLTGFEKEDGKFFAVIKGEIAQDKEAFGMTIKTKGTAMIHFMLDAGYVSFSKLDTESVFTKKEKDGRTSESVSKTSTEIHSTRLE